MADNRTKLTVSEFKKHLKAKHPNLTFVRTGGKPSKAVVKCYFCGNTYERWFHYLLNYNCKCVIKRPLERNYEERLKRFKKQLHKNVELLGKYKNSSTKVKVKCKKHNIVWEAFPSNLRKGHGCFKCGESKRERTCLAKYGTTAVLSNKKVQAKFKKTMLQRYGVEHANQNPSLLDKAIKNSAQRKIYRLGNRKIVVQGYEPQALDYLINVKGIKPSSIECGAGNKKIPKIPYEIAGRQHVYFPDIFLPSKNRLIEVKSKYTYYVSRKQNKLKRKAAKKLGYKFSFLVMNKDGTLYARK